MWSHLLMVLLFVSAIVLILLILVQRGKGGGLAGAFGGMGGQSAFGTKAGDTFTKITIGVATVWILLCLIGVRSLRSSHSKLDLKTEGSPAQTAPAAPGAGAPAPPAPSGAGAAPGGPAAPDTPAGADS